MIDGLRKALGIAREHLQIERDELRHLKEDMGGEFDPNAYGSGHCDGAIAALNHLIEELELELDPNGHPAPTVRPIADSKADPGEPAPTGPDNRSEPRRA